MRQHRGCGRQATRRRHAATTTTTTTPSARQLRRGHQSHLSSPRAPRRGPPTGDTKARTHSRTHLPGAPTAACPAKAARRRTSGGRAVRRRGPQDAGATWTATVARRPSPLDPSSDWPPDGDRGAPRAVTCGVTSRHAFGATSGTRLPSGRGRGDRRHRRRTAGCCAARTHRDGRDAAAAGPPGSCRCPPPPGAGALRGSRGEGAEGRGCGGGSSCSGEELSADRLTPVLSG